MENTPSYGLNSVDRALHLALLLRDEGPMRLSDTAQRLGIAPSTAHRLFAALMHRGFARQGEDRRYYPADFWSRYSSDPATRASELGQLALPHLQVLVSRVDETANFQTRVGTAVRFLASAACTRTLRVGDRTGRVLPAHQASGGKVLLAALTATELNSLYTQRESEAVSPTLTNGLRSELALVRRRGYALNNQETEAGVTAVGVVVPSAGGGALGAVSLALPSVRFRREDLPRLVGELSATAADIGRDVTAKAPGLCR